MNISIVFCKWFVKINGGLLLSAGGLKMHYLTGQIRLKMSDDPVFGLSSFWTLGGAALVELALGAAILLWSVRVWQMLAMFWLSSVLLLYRAALVMMGYDKECSCLGTVVAQFHIPPEQARNALVFWLVILVMGNGSLLWLQHSKARTPPVG
jgi:hypothetical protein